jgi:hypothetical protein
MVRDRPVQVVSIMPDIKRKWSFTRLPPTVRILFKGIPGVWRHRHRLIFCWLIVMQMATSGSRTLTGLISICTWFYHRMAFPAFVIRRVLESQGAPALVC